MLVDCRLRHEVLLAVDGLQELPGVPECAGVGGGYNNIHVP